MQNKQCKRKNDFPFCILHCLFFVLDSEAGRGSPHPSPPPEYRGRGKDSRRLRSTLYSRPWSLPLPKKTASSASCIAAKSACECSSSLASSQLHRLGSATSASACSAGTTGSGLTGSSLPF